MDVILRNGLEILGRLAGLAKIGGMGGKKNISIRGTRMNKTHEKIG